MAERDGGPERLGDALAGFLRARGLDERVDRAAILVEWSRVVGPQIAAVTLPRRVGADGTLFVAVSNHAWMSELSLMERELLEKINSQEGRPPIRRIRWELRR